MKEIKNNKISINALLLLVDIPLLLLLSKNLYTDMIFIYINIRLIMVCFIPLILIVKLIKTTIIIGRKSGLFSQVMSLITLKKNILDVTHICKNFLDLFIFYSECILLMLLFIYSMKKAKLILVSSNNLAIFLAIISLNFILILISRYINKRCDIVINSYEEKNCNLC